jgi:hypothetical protein
MRHPKAATITASEIVRVLNGLVEHPRGTPAEQKLEHEAYVERLKKFASSWLEAGYRLDEWSMRSVLQHDIQTMTNVLMARSDGQPYVVTLYGPGDPKVTKMAVQEGHLLASQTFVEFITSPYYRNLGQCVRCGKWFFSESRKRTRYCSSKCKSLDTSKATKETTRQRGFLAKIVKIQNAIKELEALSDQERLAISLKKGWKAWVKTKTGVSITFITRALNNGHISAPKNIQL